MLQSPRANQTCREQGVSSQPSRLAFMAEAQHNRLHHALDFGDVWVYVRTLCPAKREHTTTADRAISDKLNDILYCLHTTSDEYAACFERFTNRMLAKG